MTPDLQIGWLLDVSAAGAEFAWNWLLQSTVLISVGLIAGWMLRSKGAAVQSTIYRTTFVAALVCPASAWLLSITGFSGWVIPFPEVRSMTEVVTVVEPSALPVPAGPEMCVSLPGPDQAHDITVAPDSEFATGEFNNQRVSRFGVVDPERWSEAVLSSTSPELSATEPEPARDVEAGQDGRDELMAAVPAATVTREMKTVYTSWAYALFAVVACWWIVGAAMTVHAVHSYLGLHLVCRTAVEADETVDARCAAMAAQLGMLRPRVLCTPFVPSPCVFGVFRPTILLPDGPLTVSLQDVFVHELAHWQRRDCQWTLLRRLALSLFFFQPLLWRLSRRIEETAEEVCDDHVVQIGSDRKRYARQLVDIAELSLPPAIPAVGIVSCKSLLGRRIERILDSSRTLSTRANFFAIAGILLVGFSATVAAGLVGSQRYTPAATQSEGSSPSAVAENANVAVAAVENANDTVAAAASTGSAEQSNPATETSTRADATDTPQPTSNTAENVNDVIAVRGRVIDPDGKPVAGAIVRAVTPVWAMLKPVVGDDAEPPTVEVNSGADGRFTVTFSKQPFGDLSRFDPTWRDIWRKTKIVALSPGYGPAWIAYEEIESDEPLTLQIVPDLPVKGRVIDLEGRPIAGVTVMDGGLSAAMDENLTPWLEAVKAGELPWTIFKHTPRSIAPESADIPSSVITDEEGRFEIHGIGRERHLSLVFEGESVARQAVKVATRPMEPIERMINRPPFGGTETVFGAEFTFTAAPSRPIVGTVRDAATGEPMPGVAVESYKLANYPYSNHRVLKTVTDDKGEYRLVGMPKAAGNRLLVLPNDDQPYFMQEVGVPDPPGLNSVAVDIELHRGIWITGRVTDKATGEPAHARLHYLPLRSNKYAHAIPEFDASGNVHGDQMRYQTRADGTYRLVGLPGPAIVGANSVLRGYRKGVGADEIDAPKYENTDWFNTYRNPVNPGPKWPNVLKQINPPEGTEVVELDFELDPGLSVRINMVDPDGQPINGVKAIGHMSGGNEKTIKESSFEAVNFSPEEKRTIVFYHSERNLGWVARVQPKDHAATTVTIKLQRCATVTGRLLHEDGAPYTGLNVIADVRPSESFGKRLPSVTTDVDGRFRYTILPGSSYWLHAEGRGIESYGTIESELAIEPGETKDLGDLIYDGKSDFSKKGQDNSSAEISGNDEATSQGNRRETIASASDSSSGASGADSNESSSIAQESSETDQETSKISDENGARAAADVQPEITNQRRTAVAAVNTANAANANEEQPKPQPATGKSIEHDRLVYEGQVVSPDGEPVGGAKVVLVYWVHGARPEGVKGLSTMTDSGGRFRLETSKSAFGRFADTMPWRYAAIVASADGYGFAKGASIGFEKTGNVRRDVPAEYLTYVAERLGGESDVLKLVADDVPITGRVVDLEGQPVVGAWIRIDRVFMNQENSLDSWLEATRKPHADFYSVRGETSMILNGPQMAFVVPEVKTDKEGRFVVRGIGRERIAKLLVGGPGIETKFVVARTREGETIELPNQSSRPDSEKEVYYGAQVTHAAGPSIPVVGVVKDASTGEPIPGVLIKSDQLAGSSSGSIVRTGLDLIRIVSDERGRFRMEGLPVGRGNKILAIPPAGKPYLPAGFRFGSKTQDPEMTLDIPLTRGVPVHGRVTDARTGEPLPGRISYFAFSDNPHTRTAKGFRQSAAHSLYRSDAAGRFEAVVLPGRGIIGFLADDHQRYKRGAGAESIERGNQQFGSMVIFNTVPMACVASNLHLLHEVNPAPNVNRLELNLELNSGIDLAGKVLDPDGKPLTGYLMSGGEPFGNIWREQRNSEFQVKGLYAGETRRLFFSHPERNLAGSYLLDKQPASELTVTLEPGGSLKGRVVDNGGNPVDALLLSSPFVSGGKMYKPVNARSEPDRAIIPQNNFDHQVRTDEDGRFHINGLIPGMKYTVQAMGEGRLGNAAVPMLRGQIFADQTVRAGETKDLGNVRIQPLNE